MPAIGVRPCEQIARPSHHALFDLPWRTTSTTASTTRPVDCVRNWKAVKRIDNDARVRRSEPLQHHIDRSQHLVGKWRHRTACRNIQPGISGTRCKASSKVSAARHERWSAQFPRQSKPVVNVRFMQAPSIRIIPWAPPPRQDRREVGRLRFLLFRRSSAGEQNNLRGCPAVASNKEVCSDRNAFGKLRLRLGQNVDVALRRRHRRRLLRAGSLRLRASAWSEVHTISLLDIVIQCPGSPQ